MAGIVRAGVYLPPARMSRAMMGEAWDTPALPGERAVAAGDEDSLTLAVEAASNCVDDTEQIDAIFFASTTAPYAEKHAAATIAAVLDRRDVATADVTGSIRAGVQALRLALDAVRSGAARQALVVAADIRPAEPATAMEQLFGDGAAAFVVGGDAPVEAIGHAAVAEEFTGPWRRTGEKFVRSFDPKLETEYGFVRPVAAAVKTALAAAGADPEKTRLACSSPDPRSFAAVSKAVGVGATKEELIPVAGMLGAAHALVALASALESCAAGDTIAVAGHGEGAEAIIFRVNEAPQLGVAVTQAIAARRPVRTYEEFLRHRKLLPWDDVHPKSSTITYWRDRRQATAFEGVRCDACGTVQFPANRACTECSVLDKMTPVKLAKTGTVFTFTLDHLVGGEYLETPVPRVVVDLDGGGRVFLEMTDVDPNDVAIGMPVELTFRRVHDGSNFANYYWKARPARGGGSGASNIGPRSDGR